MHATLMPQTQRIKCPTKSLCEHLEMKQLTSIFQARFRPLTRLLGGPDADPAPADAPLPPLIRRKVPRTVIQGDTRGSLQIPCPPVTAEDAIREKHLSHAQYLVRQERWEDLTDLIETADRARHLTPGLMPVADLLAYGARADVVGAAEHALMDGPPEDDTPLLAGIEALEHLLAEHPKSHIMACIVAQAHMDIGWAWRGNSWDAEVPAQNRAVFEAHFDRAKDIISEFCPIHSDSPLLGTTCSSLLGGIPTEPREKANRYEKVIDLNPSNPRPMRALGNQMLPRWKGSYELLELEARRTAARTAQIWGTGAYTWVQFDAIVYDDEACANLDLGFFIEGLHDILERRSDPYTANLLAAYCANSIGQSYSGNDRADHHREEIGKCADWIVRKHMTELHPMVWAHAARGFDNNLRIHSTSRFAAAGRDDAMRIITSLFKNELSAGKRIVFTDQGPVAQHA